MQGTAPIQRGSLEGYFLLSLKRLVMEYKVVDTVPFNDQLPGTSGLRKKTPHFMQANYLENFIQAIFNSLSSDDLINSTLVLGGDGRYFSNQAGQGIIKMAAANGVRKLIVAQNFLMCTPGVSAVIREYKALGGILLTASHNAGGLHGDFGVKYNISNGGPAPENVTNEIYRQSTLIQSYKITLMPDIDVSYSHTEHFGNYIVEVIDSAALYVNLLKDIFDFDALRRFVHRPGGFRMVYDAMHGAAGPAARAVFIGELGLPEESVINGIPSPDFNGGHPDPNLTYAKELVKIMGLSPESKGDAPDFGAAADGDADRNMVLGKCFFVTPSDSVAIIAANATETIPYFKLHGLSGAARSMPTSGALEQVTKMLGIDFYEVPTGWKFFGTLLDSGKIGICGEESFGTGGSHIREKDGLWAVLCWLSLLEYNNRGKEEEKLVSVEQIVVRHWEKFGRNYYTRYDYEEVDAKSATNMFNDLRQRIASNQLVLPLNCGYEIMTADDFKYVDPVDGSISEKQGIRILMVDGSRIIFRLSGTGSVGATIRVYIDKYEKENIHTNPSVALRDLVEIALNVSKLQEFTGRNEPTVIT